MGTPICAPKQHRRHIRKCSWNAIRWEIVKVFPTNNLGSFFHTWEVGAGASGCTIKVTRMRYEGDSPRGRSRRAIGRSTGWAEPELISEFAVVQPMA